MGSQPLNARPKACKLNDLGRRVASLSLALLAACNSSPAQRSPASGAQSATTAPASGTTSGTSGTTGNPTRSPTPASTVTGPNVLPVHVGGASTPSYLALNRPLVSVTICTKGTNQCQTLDNIVVDTGSIGLRIFSSAVTIPTTPVAVAGGNLATCEVFGDNTAAWGPVVTMDVKLGGEPAAAMQVELIDPTYGQVPAPCAPPQAVTASSPEASELIGLLGIGPGTADCGTRCANYATNNIYFACGAAGCAQAAVPVAKQLANPISDLATDNNGAIFTLQALTGNGAGSASGQLILGIGTRANNQPGHVTVLPTDADFDLVARLSGSGTSTAALDTGTTSYVLPPIPALPSCTVPEAAAFFCPAQTTTVDVTLTGASGTPAAKATIAVANAMSIFNAAPNAYDNLAQSLEDRTNLHVLLLGLPFFYGRSVYLGIDGRSTPLGAGPFYAY